MHFTTLSAAAAVAVLASSAVACGPGGADHSDEQHKRFVQRRAALAARATSTPTEQSQAQVSDPTQECTYYYLPEVNALLPNYPTIWQTANILSNDSTAQNLFNTIKGSIPSDVKVKAGTRAGDFSNVSYTASDPDCWWTYGQAGNKCDKPKHSGIPEDVYLCNEPKTWGYTFDDGPNCTHNAFYDFLKQKNQKASMFYIGSNVMDWPLQAQRGLIDGHHICSHTWSHPYMTALTDEQVFAELYYSAKSIKDIMGITVDCWRPPYGDIDDRVRAIATGLGLKSVLWSADTSDWQIKPAGTLSRADIEKNYANIINAVSTSTGNIVLSHEINGDTMDIAMEQYGNITAKFDHVVPISACMNWTSPYAEKITYPNFAQYVAGNIEPSGLPAASDLKISSATWSPVGGGGSSAVVAAATSASGAASSGSVAAAKGSSSSSSKSSTSAAAGMIKPAVALAGSSIAVLLGAALVLA
ncbi:unnamed protein product [Parajaminaea phylloscopi]